MAETNATHIALKYAGVVTLILVLFNLPIYLLLETRWSLDNTVDSTGVTNSMKWWPQL